VCTDNYVFSIGGYDVNANSRLTNASYCVPISADGSIGSWTGISNGPIAANSVQIAIAGNRVYFIGGYDGNSVLNTVYSAAFNSGIADYTPYYTDQPNVSATTSSTLSSTFMLPNLPSTSYSAYYIKT
jgi:hypothetical protein